VRSIAESIRIGVSWTTKETEDEDTQYAEKDGTGYGREAGWVSSSGARQQAPHGHPVIEKDMVPPTGIGTLSLRSEGRQEKISGVDWLYTSIVYDLRNPLGQTRSLRSVSRSRCWARSSEATRNQYLSRTWSNAGIVGGSKQCRSWRPTAEACEVITAASDAASAAFANKRALGRLYA
jgi:hypothetical protein